jgi:pimeloyl-ACP methyl ester carboxylesterase
MTFPRSAALSLFTALAAAGCSVLTDGRLASRKAEAEAAFPPTGRLLEVDGLRVHADQRGGGPDVVLIHGASGNTRDFTFALADVLATEFRVTAFDRPGLGWSDDAGDAGVSPFEQARILRGAAAQMGLRRPVVVGHSYGGAVAMAWALLDPASTGAVVSLAGATMPWPGGLGPWYSVTGSEIGGVTVLPLVSAFASPARAERAIAGIFAPDPVPQGYAAHIGAGLTLRVETMRVNARQVARLKPFVAAMAGGYPQLEVPVEIVHGTADTIVPASVHAEPMARLLPRARLTLLEGVGHMPHHAAPEATVAAIRRAVQAAR